MGQESGTRIGGYEVLELLGDGAQGRVFRARCVVPECDAVEVGQIVALKELRASGEDEDDLRRLERHAGRLQKLIHPHLVRFFHLFIWQQGEWDERRCLVMEFLDGHDLSDRIAQAPKGMPWEDVKTIFRACLEGLIYAREQGLVHRDIKPSNVYLTKDGGIKIIDFDIAKHEGGTQSSTTGWRGSFSYMAPDFSPTYLPADDFRGDEQSDIYSLTVCFYHALTGTLPFGDLGANGAVGYLNQWSGQDVHIPRKHGAFRVLAHLGAFVEKGLSLSRENRFRTFKEMLEGLEKVKRRVIRHAGVEYIMLEVVGRGGFGVVYKALRSSDRKTVAIKHLTSSSQVDRFLREARLLSKLQGDASTQLVSYLDFIELKEQEQYFIVMEFLEGMPDAELRHRVKASNKQGLHPGEVQALFIQFLSGLQTLHDAGIHHRDIKPGNLYAPVGHPERAKILDLGIARDEGGTQTVGRVPGTIDYMAPEFGKSSDFRGSPQSDIYSMGMCLYESLAGRPIFPRLPTDARQAFQAYLQRIESPPKVDFSHAVFVAYPKLKQIVAKSVASDPRKRYRSAAEMVADLRGLGRIADWEPPEFDDDELPTRALMPDEDLEPDAEAPTEAAQFEDLAAIAAESDQDVLSKAPRHPRGSEDLEPQWQAGAEGATPPSGAITGMTRKTRIVLISSIAALLLVLASVAALVLPKIQTWRTRGDMLLRVETLRTPKASPAYTEALLQALTTCRTWGKQDAGYPFWSRWIGELQELSDNYPITFSNRFAESDDTAARRDMLAHWRALSDASGDFGWSRQAYSAISRYMGYQVGVDAYREELAGALAAIPPELSDDASWEQAESLMEKSQAFNATRWDDAARAEFSATTARLSEKLVALTTNYLDSVGSDALAVIGRGGRPTTQTQSLRLFARLAPSLSVAAGNHQDGILRQIDDALSSQKFLIAFNELQSAIAGINSSVEAAAAQADLTKLRDMAADEGERGQVDTLAQAYAARVNTVIDELAKAGEEAYRGLNFVTGDERVAALQAYTGVVDESMKTALQTRLDALAQLKQTQEQTRDTRLAEIRQRNQRLGEVVQQMSALRQTVSQSRKGLPDTSGIVALRAIPDWDTLSQDTDFQQMWSRLGQDVAAALIREAKRRAPIPERRQRVTAVAAQLTNARMQELLGKELKAVQETVDTEQAIHLVQVSNASDQEVTLSGEDMQPLILRSGASEVIVLSVTGTPDEATEIRIRGPQGYTPTPNRIVLAVQPAGGEAASITKVAPSPVAVVLREPEAAAWEQVSRSYRGAESSAWVPLNPEDQIEPATYALRYEKPDYLPQTVQFEATIGRAAQLPLPGTWEPAPALTHLFALERAYTAEDWVEVGKQIAAMPEKALSDIGHIQRLNQVRTAWQERLARIEKATAAIAAVEQGLQKDLTLAEAATRVQQVMRDYKEVSDDPALQALQGSIGKMAGDRVVSLAARTPLETRPERLARADELLKGAGAADLLGRTRHAELSKTVTDERALFVLMLRNGSDHPAVISLAGKRVAELAPGAIETLTPPVQPDPAPLSATGQKGDRPQNWALTMTAGGGESVTIQPFEQMPVRLSAAPASFPPETPPATITIRKQDAVTWTALTTPTDVAPGTYAVRITRPDYVSSDSTVTLEPGTDAFHVPMPAEWTGSPALAHLLSVETAFKAQDWTTLEALFAAPPESQLAFPPHVRRLDAVQSAWQKRVRRVKEATGRVADVQAGLEKDLTLAEAADSIRKIMADYGDIADDPTLKKLQGSVEQLAGDRIRALSEREPLATRAERLTRAHELLIGPGAEALLGTAPFQALTRRVADERAIFILRVTNTATRDTELSAGGAPLATIAAGQSVMLTPRIPPGDARIVARGAKGEKPQQWTLPVVAGGSGSITIATFEMLPVRLSVTPATFPPNTPAATVEFRRTEADAWSVLTTPREIKPGAMTLRISRPDYQLVTQQLMLEPGTPAHEVIVPPEAEWTPTEALALLRTIEAAAKDPAADLLPLFEKPCVLQDPGHSQRYAMAKERWLAAWREKIAIRTEQTLSSHSGKQSYTYQIGDPSQQKITKRSAMEPAPASTTAPLDIPEVVAAACRDELAALQAAEKAPVTAGRSSEGLRRQAHLYYPRVCQMTSFPCDVPGQLQAFGKEGHLNTYDARLALYSTYLCWDKTLKYQANETAKEANPTSWQRTLSNYARKTITAANETQALLSSLSSGESDRTLRFFQEQAHDREGADWILRYVAALLPTTGSIGPRALAIVEALPADAGKAEEIKRADELMKSTP